MDIFHGTNGGSILKSMWVTARYVRGTNAPIREHRVTPREQIANGESVPRVAALPVSAQQSLLFFYFARFLYCSVERTNKQNRQLQAK